MKTTFNTYVTLDDLLYDVLSDLISLPFNIKASRGNTSEIIGASFHLSNPRARLSKTETKNKPFSALGELIWYLAGSNCLDFISFYISAYNDDSEDGKTVYGAYGPRLFSMRNKYNQVHNIIELLRERPNSRKAVIQLYDAKDLNYHHKEFPCTTTLQFFIRNQALDIHVSMRSNDAFIGLPHDVFCFTMIQEIMARTLDVEVGQYYHSVGSLHLYENKMQKAIEYIEEGFQSTTSYMKPMPYGDPWEALSIIKECEHQIRKQVPLDVDSLPIDNYWKELLTLLQIFSSFKNSDLESVKLLMDKIDPSFHSYIKKRLVTSQVNKNGTTNIKFG